MRAVSNRFARKLADNSNMLVKASIAFADGTEKELTGDDFCAVSVESACSSAGSFDIGSAIIGKLECTLNNYDDRFSEYDFQDARLAVSVGEQFDNGETEWIRLGVYWCDQPDSYAGQIQISALDCLHKLEGKVDWSVFEYPNTLPYFAEKACEQCGLVFEASEGMRSGFSINKKPSNSDMSWLDLLGYIAQISCGFIVATDNGHVALKWYDTAAFEREEWLDGGHFDSDDPYSSGGSADGGSFADYSAGANVDGGTFLGSNGRVLVQKFSQLTVCTDDVVITGVSVTEQNEVKDVSDVEFNGEDGKTSLFGSNGYVLSIAKNPFILYSLGKDVSSSVGKRCVGMRFRPFSADIVADPSIEVGDPVVIIDRKDNVYRSYVTGLTLNVNGSMSISCEAKSPGRNAAEQASAATKAIVAARNDLKREQTARELAYRDLQDKVAESGGLYTTRQTLADGSTVTFMHNRADLASSKVIWKMTAEAMAVSTDGGKTYATGLSADGTALLNRIYAIGLNADYITTGTLTVTDDSGKTILRLGKNAESGIEAMNPISNEMMQLSYAAFAGKVGVKNADRLDIVSYGEISAPTRFNSGDVKKELYSIECMASSDGAIEVALDGYFFGIISTRKVILRAGDTVNYILTSSLNVNVKVLNTVTGKYVFNKLYEDYPEPDPDDENVDEYYTFKLGYTVKEELKYIYNEAPEVYADIRPEKTGTNKIDIVEIFSGLDKLTKYEFQFSVVGKCTGTGFFNGSPTFDVPTKIQCGISKEYPLITKLTPISWKEA